MNKPRIGVAAVLLNKHNQVLIGKRLSKLGKGTFHFPGGHLEFHESLIQCAAREVREETGLTIMESDFTVIAFTEDLYSDCHYVTFFVGAKIGGLPAQNIEPDKCEGWHWIDLPVMEDLRLFPAINNLLANCSEQWQGFING